MDENYSELFIKNRIADGPLSLLELSPRAYNMLRLNGVFTLRQLAELNIEKLEALDYSTRQIAQEIALRLSDYLHDPQNLLPEPKNGAGAEGAKTAAPIEKLKLSVRSYNCLKRVGLHTVQALVGKTEEELLQIRNLGARSAAEIVEAVKRWLESPQEEETAEAMPEAIKAASSEKSELAQPLPPDERPIEDLNLSVRSFNALMRAKIDTIQKLLDLTPQELKEIRNLGAKSLEELETVRKNYTPPASAAPKTDYTAEELKPLILGAFQHPYQGLSWQEFRDAMPETAADSVIKHAVGALLAEQKLEYVDYRCYRVYPSFYEELDRYLETADKRNREVMARRYAGETLEAIAQDFGLQRERIRQIQAKENKKLRDTYKARTGFPVFAEDFYETLYTRCELPDAFWSEELALPERSINYLKFTYTRGKTKPEEILRDEAIPVSLRYRVRSFLDRDKIRIDGRLFPKNRADIEDYAMQKYAQDEITFERFIQLYNGMLEDNDIPFDEKIYYTEGVIRTRANRIGDSRHCLWKQGARLRWYDIDARDYTALLEKLNLDSYQNTEVSTRKFLRQFPELMDEYDIRDPYELHNLLKKISDRYALNFVDFSRQPVLQFGEYDRVRMILNILEAFSPITQEELYEYLAEEYGMEGGMFPYHALKQYYHNGVYSADRGFLLHRRDQTTV